MALTDNEEALLVELVEVTIKAVVRLANAVVGADRAKAMLDAEHAASNAQADAIERERFGGGELSTAPATPEAKEAARKAQG